MTTTLAFQRCKRSSGIDLPGIERHCVLEAFLRKIFLSDQQIGLAEQEMHGCQLRLVMQHGSKRLYCIFPVAPGQRHTAREDQPI